MTNAKGIDVSKWQAETPPLAGLDFLFARASVGTDHDERYAHHILNAQARGLVTGAYHFGYTGSTSAQVRTFLDAAGDVDLYALDVEGSKAQTHEEARAFIKAVQATGRLCGLYHSESGFFDAGQDFDWIAKWATTPPRRHWDFWQYRGSPLDLDQYQGTRAELDAFIGKDGDTLAKQLPITDTTPHMVDCHAPVTHFDLDGSVISEGHSAITNAESPYIAMNGTSSFYAVYAGPPPYRLILTKPSAVRPMPDQDCSDEIAADRAAAMVAVVYPD